MRTDLSPTMLAAYEVIKEGGGKLHRFPGGYWRTVENANIYFGMQTVHALVTRGVAFYSNYRDGIKGRFPVEITLEPEKKP